MFFKEELQMLIAEGIRNLLNLPLSQDGSDLNIVSTSMLLITVGCTSHTGISERVGECCMFQPVHQVVTVDILDAGYWRDIAV